MGTGSLRDFTTRDYRRKFPGLAVNAARGTPGQPARSGRGDDANSGVRVTRRYCIRMQGLAEFVHHDRPIRVLHQLFA